MWAWIIETGTERILVDAGARPGAGGGVTRTTFQISFIADVEQHHVTLRRVLALIETGVAYLPSHDPEAPTRL
jgi:hypothetical protein